MNQHKIAAVALSVATAATLAGCGSNSTSTTASAAAPVASAGSNASTTTSTPSPTMASTPSSPAASTASTPTASASVATVATAKVKTTDLAKKLGCTNPVFKPSSAKAAATGAVGGVTCSVGTRQVVLAEVARPSDLPKLEKDLASAIGEKFPILQGDDWLALMSAADGKSAPTKAELAPLAEKTGATVVVVG